MRTMKSMKGETKNPRRLMMKAVTSLRNQSLMRKAKRKIKDQRKRVRHLKARAKEMKTIKRLMMAMAVKKAATVVPMIHLNLPATRSREPLIHPPMKVPKGPTTTWGNQR